MALSKEKKDYLEAAGVKDLDGLEKSLTAGKTIAESLGLESKSEGDATEEAAPEVAPEVVPEVVAPVVPEPAAPTPVAPVATPVEVVPAAAPAAPVAPVAPAPEAPVEDAPAEVAEEGFSDMQTKQLVEALSILMDTFEKKIDIKLAPIVASYDALVSAEDELISQTPAASVQDMILNKKWLGDMSALTSIETVVDKRTKFSKDGPVEEKELEPITNSGNPLLDRLTANLLRPDWEDQFATKKPLVQV